MLKKSVCLREIQQYIRSRPIEKSPSFVNSEAKNEAQLAQKSLPKQTELWCENLRSRGLLNVTAPLQTGNHFAIRDGFISSCLQRMRFALTKTNK